MRWIALLMFGMLIASSWFATGCGKKTSQADTTKTDSSYVSDHFLTDTVPSEPEPEDNHKSHHSSSHHSSSSGSDDFGGGSSYSTAGQVWSSKYQNYQRNGTDAKDFAEAMVWHVIRMSYDEDFKAAKSRVISSDKQGDQYTIEMEVVWSDEWVSNYKVKGTLTVKEDGTGAQFTTTEKNSEAEALEFTHENSKSVVTIDQL